MDTDNQYLSQEKYDEIVKELEELKTVKRKEIADALEYARSLGDLSENAEYQEAREDQAKLESRISELKEIIKNAQIISDKHGSTVTIGSVVTVKSTKGGDKREFTVVGSAEADFSQNKLSNDSPLGKCVLGKKKGDEVDCNTPKGLVKYEILSVK